MAVFKVNQPVISARFGKGIIRDINPHNKPDKKNLEVPRKYQSPHYRVEFESHKGLRITVFENEITDGQQV